ncbi:hypothetical protein [Parasitella parasitica]|uniref:Uncharacterized protein n=1 Tax=Parasitella parasitica TaxID=35722 RepID=A0A0B7N3F8_9FUNG|nr:hypothetical protein [Parasitella parasitica]
MPNVFPFILFTLVDFFMTEVDEEDPFEYDFDPADLELTAALEEQLSSTQPTSLFPTLTQTQQSQTPRSNLTIPHPPQQQREPQINAEASRLIEELRQKLSWRISIGRNRRKEISHRRNQKERILKNFLAQNQRFENPRPIQKTFQCHHPQTYPSIRQASTPPTQSPMLSAEQYTPPVRSETQFRTIPSAALLREHSKPPLPPASYSVEIKQTLPNKCKPQPHSKLNASTLHMTMLKVIFADVVKEYSKDRSANLNMLLSPSKIRTFAQLYSAKFAPTTKMCAAHAKERLKMIASDIKDLLIRSQDAEFTISSLLIQFGLCLPICTEERLYDIIHAIAKTLQALSSSLPIARDLLIKEIKFSLVNSNVYKLVQALSLYSFKKPPPMYHLVEENPEITTANSTEMIRIAEKYSTVAPAVAEALQYEKTPPRADATVKCVLFVLSSVGSFGLKATLLFLLTDKAFLDLLSPNTPMDILETAIAVINLNTRDRNWMAIEAQAVDKKPPLFVTRMCQLLEIKQNSQSENWYLFSNRLLYLLGEICLMQLPENLAVATKKAIFSTVIDFIVRGCEFKASGHSNKLIAAHKKLAKAGCGALLRVMKANANNSFEYDNKSTTQLRNLVAFYVDNNEDESHPARNHLLAIEKLLDRM